MSNAKAIGSFIESAPPGEVSSKLSTRASKLQTLIYNNSCQTSQLVRIHLRTSKQSPNPEYPAAVKSIVGDNALSDLQPAFEKYNEEQFTTVTLPGGSESVRNSHLEQCLGVPGLYQRW